MGIIRQMRGRKQRGIGRNGLRIPIISAFTLIPENLERRPLWIPILMGMGVGLYFLLPFEPVFWQLIIVTSLAWLIVLISKYAGLFSQNSLGTLSAIILSGLCLASFENWRVAAPVITDSRYAREIQGTITQLEQRPTGLRIILEEIHIPDAEAAYLPARIRVSYRGDIMPRIGERVSIEAVLRAPPEPSVPGLYDFTRRAWFQSLGGTGFAVSEITSLSNPGDVGADSIKFEPARLRQILNHEISAAMKNNSISSIATALITGDRSGITEETRNIMRDAGLSHLLAISGLHMGLVVMILFTGSRFTMAFFPILALNYPIKKIAACIALSGSLVYLILAGAPVPTQRAFLMTTLVLLAVLIDRNAFSMRMVAFAATIILILSPHVLTGASFQLSFAAVVALVALYETDMMRNWSRRMRVGLSRRILGYFLLLIVTTLVASMATAPLALHHFGVFAAYGILGNLVGVPLMAFVIMPGAVLALVLMPFGLQNLGFGLMEGGISVLFGTAKWVAGLEGAIYQFPMIGLLPILLITAGGLWTALWVGRIRFLGIIGLLLGVIAATLSKTPDLLIAGNGKLIAFQSSETGLVFNQQKSEKFTIRQWKQLLGTRASGTFNDNSGGGLFCDSHGCILDNKGQKVSFILKPEAFAEDCRISTLLISTNHWADRFPCPNPDIILDRGFLRENGGVAIYLDGQYPWQEGVTVQTVRDYQGNRPWSPWHKQAGK